MKKIEELNGIPTEGITLAYLEGVIVGSQFISAGKEFWITGNEEDGDAQHVYIKHLYTEAAE